MPVEAIAEEGVDVHGIDQTTLINNWLGIHKLEDNWTALGESPWEIEHFKKDLPGKWNLSNLAIHNGKVVGYMIASLDSLNRNVARINKVLIDRNSRGKGIATQLWYDFINRCETLGVRKVKLRALKENDAANGFYKKNGCIFTGETLGDDQRTRYDLEYVLSAADPIPHSRPTTSGADCELFREPLEKGELATGRYVAKFINEMSMVCGQRSGIATANGTAAIYLALRALGVGKKDEVLIPSYACTSLLRPIRDIGATAVLVDINPHDYNISLEDAREKLTGKTQAVIVPHMFGEPVRNIEEFSRQLNVPIIEDCAHSIGAMINGNPVGSFGDISIFSFYATKMLTTGVGGMALTGDGELLKNLKRLTSYDRTPEFEDSYNVKMSDLQAALGLSQLKRLPEFLAARQDVAKRYNQLFKSANVDFDLPVDNSDNVFFRYIINHSDPLRLIANLRERGIGADRPIFKPLHEYLGQSGTRFPNTQQAYGTAVSIPIYPTIKADEINSVAGALANWRTR